MKLRDVLKLILALSIPAILVGGFFYAQNQANKEVADYKKFQTQHPPTQAITIDNYQLKEVDDSNQMRWQLQAKQGTMAPDTKDVDLHEVLVQYFDQGKVKMSLTAPSGIANESTKQVQLLAKGGKQVLATGEDGKAQMNANKVELTKKNSFIASGGVTILYPGVAKVTGSTVTGSLEKSAELKNFTIKGGTHATIGHI
jgi:LPS export ABC transporter protein LptC